MRRGTPGGPRLPPSGPGYAAIHSARPPLPLEMPRVPAAAAAAAQQGTPKSLKSLAQAPPPPPPQWSPPAAAARSAGTPAAPPRSAGTPVSQLVLQRALGSEEVAQAQSDVARAKQHIAAAQATPDSAGQKETIESLEMFIAQQEHIAHIIQLITAIGLNWIEVSGNGNCYFLALSFALTNTFPDIKSIQNNFIALFLRKLAVEGVVRNADQLHAETDWPQYNDIYGEEHSTRTPRFEALSLESKKLLYKKIMSKFYVWAGDYESGQLIQYLNNYCYQIYNYGQHARNKSRSFAIDIERNCGNPRYPKLKLFHTGNHYDALLTNEELRNFEQLPARTEVEFRGRSNEDITQEFIHYLEDIKRANTLAEIVRLEESINLIKIEILRRNGDIDRLNQLYNRAIGISTHLLEAEGAIEWEASADFAAWEAGEVAEGHSKVAEQPGAALARAAELRRLLRPSAAAAAAPAAAVARSREEEMAELSALMRQKRGNDDHRADQVATELLTATPERLLPGEFLDTFPTPKDAASQANEVYKGYNEGFYAIHHIIVRKLREGISFNEIIPRYKREGANTIGGLLQSNSKFAADPPSLKTWKIKLIIQASNDQIVIDEIRAGMDRIPEADRPLLLELNMRDDETQDIKSSLTKSLKYKGQNLPLLDLIEAVREDGGSVVVNCAAGMSRSAAIILMYLMRRDTEKNMSFLNAWRFLKYKRPVIIPNLSFIKQLQAYEQEIRGESTVTHELFNLNPLLLVHAAQSVKASLPAKPKGLCEVCEHQNPPNAAACEQCTMQLSTKGGKRKTHRKKAKSKRAKSQKKKYRRV